MVMLKQVICSKKNRAGYTQPLEGATVSIPREELQKKIDMYIMWVFHPQSGLVDNFY